MPSYIAPEILEEIITRTDIVEVISSYLPLKKMGRNYVGLCPFHNEDTPSFTVSPDKQIFYCFGCQKGGNALHFLMEEEGLTFSQAGEKLASRCGVKIPEAPQSAAMAKRGQERQSLLRIHETAANFYRKTLAFGNHSLINDYLRKRNISEEIQNKFQLGYSPEEDWAVLSNYLLEQGFSKDLLEKSGLSSKSVKNGRFYDKFHGRLIFPITDPQGQVIAFGGRIVGEGQPKYLNSPQTLIYEKSRQLFGLKIAIPAIRQEAMAVIVEGYMDVIACHQAGVENAVAPLGTAFTSEQAHLLKRYTNNVLLAFDGDSAGLKAATKSIDILRENKFNVKVMTFPDQMDPDDFLRQNGKQGWDDFYAQKALSALEFLYEQTRKKIPGNSSADKGMIVMELMPYIAKTASNVERAGFISFLAGHLEVEESAIYGDLRKSGFKISNNAVVASKKQEKTSQNSLEYKILRLLLEDEESCRIIIAELGQDFFKDERSRQIIDIALELVKKGSLNQAIMLNYFDEEFDSEEESDNNLPENPKFRGLKQFLLKILQISLPFDGSKEGKEALVREYIKACHILQLNEKITQLTISLAATSGKEMKEILEEIKTLQQELQLLKCPPNLEI